MVAGPLESGGRAGLPWLAAIVSLRVRTAPRFWPLPRRAVSGRLRFLVVRFFAVAPGLAQRWLGVRAPPSKKPPHGPTCRAWPGNSSSLHAQAPLPPCASPTRRQLESLASQATFRAREKKKKKKAPQLGVYTSHANLARLPSTAGGLGRAAPSPRDGRFDGQAHARLGCARDAEQAALADVWALGPRLVRALSTSSVCTLTLTRLKSPAEARGSGFLPRSACLANVDAPEPAPTATWLTRKWLRLILVRPLGPALAWSRLRRRPGRASFARRLAGAGAASSLSASAEF